MAKKKSKLGQSVLFRFVAASRGYKPRIGESLVLAAASCLRELVDGAPGGTGLNSMRKFLEAHADLIISNTPSKSQVNKRCKAKKPALVVALPAKDDVASDAFLSTYEWRRVRMVALKRYGARCQCCGATPADGIVINVDHIKPRRLFPELALDVDNLQVLCNPCNHGKGNWDMTDWRPASNDNLEQQAA